MVFCVCLWLVGFEHVRFSYRFKCRSVDFLFFSCVLCVWLVVSVLWLAKERIAGVAI